MPKLSIPDNDRYRVVHMIEFCEKLAELTSHLSEEILEGDWMQTYAIMQLFEMLGEAANKVSGRLKEEHPEIPWQDTTDLRNRLIHGYNDIEYHLLWYGLEHDLPSLLDQLYQLRKEWAL